MRCWHLTFAANDRQIITHGEAQRRRAVWILGTITGGGLVLFCFVDDHLHVVIVCPVERLGWARRRLTLGLRRALAAEVRHTGTREIQHRSHLESLVGYHLRQPQHHGLDVHPATWSGSCFPDLVGARRIPTVSLRVFELLPRWKPSQVFGIVDLPVLPPANDDQVRTAGAARLIQAAAAAFGLSPDLAGRSPHVANARRAATQIAASVSMSAAELDWALEITGRTRRRLLAGPPDPEAQRAVRLQLAIEDAVARRAR